MKKNKKANAFDPPESQILTTDTWYYIYIIVVVVLKKDWFQIYNVNFFLKKIVFTYFFSFFQSVPISKLIEYVSKANEFIRQSRLNAPLVGHIGDGNLHFFIVFSKAQQTQAHRLNTQLVRLALACQGTCTGEHGLGIGKKKFLASELGDEAVRVMQMIKHAFDPLNLFCPDHVVPQLSSKL